MGYGGPLTHQAITLTASTWQTFDVNSLYGVPADATGVVIHAYTTGGTRIIGARANGDTSTDSLIDITNGGMVQLICAIGTSTSIDVYSENYTQTSFYITWYFGDEAYFLSTATDVTPAEYTSSSTWDDVDITSHLDGGDDAGAAIVLAKHDSTVTYVSLRPNGDTRDTSDGLAKGFCGIVPVDTEDILQIRRNNAGVELYLLGYIKDSSGWAFGITPSSTDVMSDNDGNYDNLTQQSEKTAIICFSSIDTTSSDSMDIRKTGTSTDYSGYPGGKGSAWFVIELDSSGYAEAKSASGGDYPTIYTYGTWIKPSSDALYEGTINQSTMTKNTYVKIPDATVAPTENTLTVTISAEGSDLGDVVVADNIGISLTPP